MKKRLYILFVMVFALATLLAACGTDEPEVVVITQQVVLTATAGPTQTPIPTRTVPPSAPTEEVWTEQDVVKFWEENNVVFGFAESKYGSGYWLAHEISTLTETGDWIENGERDEFSILNCTELGNELLDGQDEVFLETPNLHYHSHLDFDGLSPDTLMLYACGQIFTDFYPSDMHWENGETTYTGKGVVDSMGDRYDDYLDVTSNIFSELGYPAEDYWSYPVTVFEPSELAGEYVIHDVYELKKEHNVAIIFGIVYPRAPWAEE